MIEEKIQELFECNYRFFKVKNELYVLSERQTWSKNYGVLFLVNDIVSPDKFITSIIVNFQKDTDVLFLSSQKDIILQHIFNNLKTATS